MPNFPPGTPNNASVTPVPLLVFTPTPNVQASCRFTNLGSSTVYIGGPNVSPTNGLPVLPGNRPVDLQNVNVNLYACCGYNNPVSAGTLSAAASAGATTLSVGTGTMALNSFLRIGNAAGYEFVQQTGGNTTGTVTVATALLYDHASGVTVSTVSALPVPLSVQAGVL